MSTKATVRQLAREAYGDGASTDAHRSICTWWRVRVLDSEGRVQHANDHKSLRTAYARCAIELRGVIDRKERIAAGEVVESAVWTREYHS